MYKIIFLQPGNVHITYTSEDLTLRSNYLYMYLLGFDSKISPNTCIFNISGISLRKNLKILSIQRYLCTYMYIPVYYPQIFGKRFKFH